jgi:hypothetical protein
MRTFLLYVYDTPDGSWKMPYFVCGRCLYLRNREIPTQCSRKLQSGLTGMNSWYERWNISINGEPMRRVSPYYLEPLMAYYYWADEISSF